MSFQQIVKEAETKFEETINLQEQLYSVEAENIENIKKYILSSSFLCNRESFSVLLRCIDGAINSRPLSFPYYLDIIQSISDQIRSNFTSYELFTDLIQNNYLRFKLYELGFIKLSTVLFYLKKNSNDLKLFFIFAFEVKSHDPFLYQSYTSQSSDFREYLSHISSEEHSSPIQQSNSTLEHITSLSTAISLWRNGVSEVHLDETIEEHCSVSSLPVRQMCIPCCAGRCLLTTH